jgi:hypothetical protein
MSDQKSYIAELEVALSDKISIIEVLQRAMKEQKEKEQEILKKRSVR